MKYNTHFGFDFLHEIRHEMLVDAEGEQNNAARHRENRHAAGTE